VSKKALFSRIKWFCNAHPELFKPARPNAPLEKSLFSRGESLCNARLGKFGGNKSARRIFRSDFSREISFFSQPEIVQAQPSKMPPMKKPYFREENRFATLVWEGLGTNNPPGESYEAIFLEKIRLFSQPEIIQAQPSEMPFRKRLIFPRKIVLQRSPGKIRWWKSYLGARFKAYFTRNMRFEPAGALSGAPCKGSAWLRVPPG
jgi:hypothetical protein